MNLRFKRFKQTKRLKKGFRHIFCRCSSTNVGIEVSTLVACRMFGTSAAATFDFDFAVELPVELAAGLLVVVLAVADRQFVARIVEV